MRELPGVVLGGNVFGWTADEQQSFAVLDAAVDAGLTAIDTADVYSAWAHDGTGGQSEAIIGRWLASRGADVQVHTKVGMQRPDRANLRPATTRAACEDSLGRLGIDRIDLYYAHQDDGDDLAEAMAGFDALVREGKVAAIGLSNFTRARVDEAVAVCAREGFAAPVALQPEYSLMERGLEDERLLDAGLAVLPYATLASGFLSGKYRPGTTVDSVRSGKASAYLESARGPRVLAALDEVAAAHGVEVPAVALAWLRAQPGVTAPIASARTVEQVAALAQALTLELAPHEVRALTSASA